ncbi:hypothetical protein [Polaribacter huanghezhanensis]|uniref:hypothetical protein n=1 Tax=Polaribacter huanghezhanensis TaxID=1354726 RepID=UPI002648C25F|nr:hypothetical protein [Polaribacter huanghezhanensis]
MADKTDSLIPSPKSRHINSFFKDLRFSSGKKVFRYLTITDASINEAYQIELPASERLENSLKRKMLKDTFYKQIESLLSVQSEKTRIYDNSSIIKPLITQLQKIQEIGSTRKVLLLYSDILEASDALNVYQEKSQSRLLTNPKDVAKELSSKLVVPKLNDVELYIIYYPNNVHNNRLFEKMTEVYQELFKNSGLKITIGIDNSIKL